MNVMVFTTQYFNQSGVERLSLRLSAGLQKKGITTTLLSMYSGNMPGVKEHDEKIKAEGIDKILFLDLKVHPTIADILGAVIKLRKILIAGRYDAIETSMIIPSIITAWATFGTSIKHLMGIHCVYLKERENTFKHKMLKWSVKINRRVHVYGISDYVVKTWIEYSKINPERVQRIYNSIEEKWFCSKSAKQLLCREFGFPADIRIISYVGRIAEFKGVNTILRAVGPLIGTFNLAILYAGVPDEYLQNTKSMISEMNEKIVEEGWDSRVKFIGFRDNVEDIVASSEILVHPSKTEGFGLVVVEAMAAGVQVVASNVDALPEILSNTDSLLVEPENESQLRNAVVNVLNRTEGEKKMVIQKGLLKAKQFREEYRIGEIIKCLGNNEQI